jgi:hypothetical protein
MYKHWPTYASNGRLAFRSMVDEGGAAERVTVDGEAQREYGSVGTPRFDDAGAHVAYDARRDGKGFMVVDGLESAPFDRVGSPRFVGAHRVGFVAREKRLASWVVLDCSPRGTGRP